MSTEPSDHRRSDVWPMVRIGASDADRQGTREDLDPNRRRSRQLSICLNGEGLVGSEHEGTCLKVSNGWMTDVLASINRGK
jgi:hypothetical protein